MHIQGWFKRLILGEFYECIVYLDQATLLIRGGGLVFEKTIYL